MQRIAAIMAATSTEHVIIGSKGSKRSRSTLLHISPKTVGITKQCQLSIGYHLSLPVCFIITLLFDVMALTASFRSLDIVSMITFKSRYINMQQCADYLGCSLSTVQKMIKRKLIPNKKVGRRVFIDQSLLDESLSRLDRNVVKIHDHSGTRPKAKLSTLASRQ
jgi:excisionase family DNA binding protein